MASDKDLLAVLNDEKDSLAAMAKSARAHDQPGFMAAAARVLTAAATRIPFLGALAEEGVRAIWSRSSYAQFQAHLAELEAEEAEQARMEPPTFCSKSRGAGPRGCMSGFTW